jgi:SAM-dependent methyltransferase
MKSLNRLLTNQDRIDEQPIIDLMFSLCPEMMSRKIPEANVQQAFVFGTVEGLFNPGNSILGVGIFEDTAYASLVESGYNIVGIDPDVNGQNLHQFFTYTTDKFDIIFSTSVLEHVNDDELFIKEICELLNPGGYAILTVDFKDSYKQGDPLHATAVRYYTKYDLETRLPAILKENQCELIQDTNYNGEPDFIYQGHLYSLATFIFRKITNV